MERLTGIRAAIDDMDEHLTDNIRAQNAADRVYLSQFFLLQGFSLMTGYAIGGFPSLIPAAIQHHTAIISAIIFRFVLKEGGNAIHHLPVLALISIADQVDDVFAQSRVEELNGRSALSVLLAGTNQFMVMLRLSQVTPLRPFGLMGGSTKITSASGLVS